MSPFHLILLSLRHFWKMNAAVACGVAVGTAVLTGALLVGDSMRGSLRDLVLSGLGNIDEALVADHFFREQLADGDSGKMPSAPVILELGGLEAADRESPAKVDQINVIGCDGRFWGLFGNNSPKPPQGDEIVLNEPLARLLAVKQGDFVLLSLAKPGAIPAESALGRKRAALDTMRLRVASLIPADGLGRFTLRPNQQAPLNAYVALKSLQTQLQEPGRVNAVFRSAPEKALPWHPQLADYGIRDEQAPEGYIDITSERLIFAPAIERAIDSQLHKLGLGVQPALTYLANSITLAGREVPYSTISAIDFQDHPPLGPFLSADGKPVPTLGDGDIAVNDWAAERLKAKTGDQLAVTYYEPESTTGLLQERTVKLKLVAIVKLAGAAADRRLAPTVRGLTDKASIEDWDLPFQLKPGHIKTADDRYWRQYAATPKAFVSLTTGRKMWGSRFGQTTSLRVAPAPGMTAASLAARLDLDPAEQGFIFLPVKNMALDASAGTTPFGLYFLYFSFFVIAAAVMLVVLLFRLGIEQRAKQLGLLLALGFPRRRAARLLMIEGLIVAAAGSAIGALGGVGYAALMLLGLRTWWLPAIGTPFLTLHVEWLSPVIGFASGLALAAIAIWLGVWRVGRIAPRRLMAGDSSTQYPVLSTQYSESRRSPFNLHFSFFNFHFSIISPILLLMALLPPLALLLVPLNEDARVGAFFGAGSWTLVTLLVLVYRELCRGATGAAVARGRGNLMRLAIRNAARNPGRSALAIGLTASACFLIAAVSVFRVDPGHEVTDNHSGSGGFALLGQSLLPVYYDLNSPNGRKELGASRDDEALLADCRFYAFRVKPGDDASCLNLYQPKQPRMLGVGADFIARDGFSWADSPVGLSNPWEVLGERPAKDGTPAPAKAGTASGAAVVMDQTTASYSLNPPKGRGDTYTVTDAHDRTITLKVAGLLNDSAFQGDLLLAEESLRRYDPEIGGYRYFLIETPADKTAEVQQALQRVLGDYGFRTETTVERLESLAAVQNTYLATFQSLGGLGLMLGTIGLAVVQWRNVLERRGELALLRAAGYSKWMLGFLVAAESVILLAAGLFVGIAAAIVAVVPQLVGRAGTAPLKPLGMIFVLVLAIGLLASLAAVRLVVRTPVLAALRDER
jgi:putative ABC transport system permease protein